MISIPPGPLRLACSVSSVRRAGSPLPEAVLFSQLLADLHRGEQSCVLAVLVFGRSFFEGSFFGLQHELQQALKLQQRILEPFEAFYENLYGLLEGLRGWRRRVHT